MIAESRNRPPRGTLRGERRRHRVPASSVPGSRAPSGSNRVCPKALRGSGEPPALVNRPAGADMHYKTNYERLVLCGRRSWGRRTGAAAGGLLTTNWRDATCWSAGRKGRRSGRVPGPNNRRRLRRLRNQVRTSRTSGRSSRQCWRRQPRLTHLRPRQDRTRRTRRATRWPTRERRWLARRRR